jgi:hypothetical protein
MACRDAPRPAAYAGSLGDLHDLSPNGQTRCALGLWFSPSVGSCQEPTIAFADDAVGEPDLHIWRTRLLEALANRDTAALFAVLNPNILNSFGGDGGIGEFKEQWQLSSAPERSEVWELLIGLLREGGRFVQGGIFAAPFYTFAPVTPPLPPGLDGFETLVVIGEQVPARAAPSVEAPVLATLTLAVVQIDRQRVEVRDSARRVWVPIVLIHAQVPGWIDKSLVRSRIDYRLGIARSPAGWEIRSLVAGD